MTRDHSSVATRDGVTIGVVIPYYQRPDDVAAAIASVQQQTRLPDQIIVVDDGSDAPLVLDAGLMRPVPVRVIRIEKNAGPAAARQLAIDALATTHIAFLDSDDTWRATKLQSQLAVLAALGWPERTAIACGWADVTATGKVLSKRIPKAATNVADFASGCWYAPGSTVLMPRQTVIDIGGFDTALRRLEDLDLFLRFSLSRGALVVAPIIGANIRNGRNAAMATVNPAVAHISAKFQREGRLRGHHDEAAIRNRLEAWLAVEEANAAFNDGAYFWAIRRMLRSLYNVPRVTIQLERWWLPLPSSDQ